MLASKAEMSRASTPAALFSDFRGGPKGDCLSLNYSQWSVWEIARVHVLGANSKSEVFPMQNAQPKGPQIGPVGHCAYSLSGEHIFLAQTRKSTRISFTFDKRSKSQDLMSKKDTFLCGKATTTINTLSAQYVFLMQGWHFWSCEIHKC